MKRFKGLCMLILLALFIPFAGMQARAASKVKINVLTGEKLTYYGSEMGSASVTYNKNGLVTSYRSSGNTREGGAFWDYKYFSYNKKNQIKRVRTDQRTFHEIDYKYTYDSKGRIKKYTEWSVNGYYMENPVKGKVKAYKCKYNKKNRLVKTIQTYDRFGNEKKTRSFSYKGNKLINRASTSAYDSSSYVYDGKGNYTKASHKTYKNCYSGTTYKNYYSGSKLVRRDWGNGHVTYYTYTTIKIPKKMKKKVKAQQWALLNDNNNFALGIYE